jgi:hypothetical protein
MGFKNPLIFDADLNEGLETIGHKGRTENENLSSPFLGQFLNDMV